MLMQHEKGLSAKYVSAWIFCCTLRLLVQWFHWLKSPQRVQYKLATVVYRSLNGTAPSYLAADLRWLSNMTSRRRLRSSLTHQLDVRQSQCATVGDRAFATAGARLWNSLPADIVVRDTFPQFRRERKFLFRQSYPSILL